MKFYESLSNDFKISALPYLDSLWQMSFCLTRDETKAAELVKQSYAKSLELWNRVAGQLDCRTLLLKSSAEIFLLGLPRDERIGLPTANYNMAHNNDAEGEPISPDSAPCSILSKAIANIPADIRLMIILSIHWGLSYNEIADITGIELEIVRAKMQSGRVALRNELIKVMGNVAEPHPDHASVN